MIINNCLAEEVNAKKDSFRKNEPSTEIGSVFRL
jgi:hypothetical protein